MDGGNTPRRDDPKIEAARNKEMNDYHLSLPDEDDRCYHWMKFKNCVKCTEKIFDTMDTINEKYDDMYPPAKNS